MKRFNRLLSMLVAVLMAVIVLSGCGSSGNTGSAPISTTKQSTSDLGGNTSPTEYYGLSMPSFTVATGQTITVPVNLNTAGQICTFEITLAYDNGVVNLADYGVTNSDAGFAGMVVVNPDNGKVIGITLIPQQGSVTLANLHFKGVATGKTTISLTGAKGSCDGSTTELAAASTTATTF